MIDTPGHVDFHYEVSRSLACCEGAVLLVDAFQGVEAQTVANAYAAMEHDLAIVPVLNKIDLQARPARRSDAGNGTGAWASIRPTCCRAAARRAWASRSCSRRIVERIPPPAGDPDAPLQAMVFDSHYDEYRGAITYVRLMNGTVAQGPEDPLHQDRHHATKCSSSASSCRSAGPASNCRPARSAI